MFDSDNHKNNTIIILFNLGFKFPFLGNLARN